MAEGEDGERRSNPGPDTPRKRRTSGSGSSPGRRQKRPRGERRVPHRDWTRYPTKKERPAAMGLRPSHPPPAPQQTPAQQTPAQQTPAQQTPAQQTSAQQQHSVQQPSVQQPYAAQQQHAARQRHSSVPQQPAPSLQPSAQQQHAAQQHAVQQQHSVQQPSVQQPYAAQQQQTAQQQHAAQQHAARQRHSSVPPQPAPSLQPSAAYPSALPHAASAASHTPSYPPTGPSAHSAPATEAQERPPRSISPVGRVVVVPRQPEGKKRPSKTPTIPMVAAGDPPLHQTLVSSPVIPPELAAKLNSNKTLHSNLSEGHKQTLRSEPVRPQEAPGETREAVNEVLRRAALRQRARKQRAFDPNALPAKAAPQPARPAIEPGMHPTPQLYERPRRRSSDPLAVTTPMVQAKLAREMERRLATGEERTSAPPAEGDPILDRPARPQQTIVIQPDSTPPPEQEAERLSDPADASPETERIPRQQAAHDPQAPADSEEEPPRARRGTELIDEADRPDTAPPRTRQGTELITGTVLPDPDAKAEPAPADQSGAFAEVSPFFLADRAFPELPRAPRATAKAAPRPTVKLIRLNRWLFRGAIFGPFIGAIVAGIVAANLEDPSAAIAALVALLVMAYAGQLIFIYRMWSSIQDSYAPVKPAKAALLLLIPLFNIYWIFRVLPGFATAYNSFTARYLLRVPRLSQNLLLASLVVPGVAPIFYWIAIGKICEAINAIPTGPRSPASIRVADVEAFLKKEKEKKK